jgi:hypothetical protein
MPEIPEEALHAAEAAIVRELASGDPFLMRPGADYRLAVAVVEAVAPILAEHIAARIADACPYAGEQPGHPCDYEDAARIARETFPPTRTPGHPNATPTGDPT